MQEIKRDLKRIEILENGRFQVYGEWEIGEILQAIEVVKMSLMKMKVRGRGEEEEKKE